MEDLLVAVRAIVSLAAVLGLLLWLRARLTGSRPAGRTPAPGGAAAKRTRLAALLPARAARRTPADRVEKITVLARSGLGGRSQLVVAEFAGIRYILGVTEHGISVVDTQEAPAAEGDAVKTVA